MGKIQITQKSLPCRIAVATGAGLLAVVAGLGMAPAGAADDVSAEAAAGGEIAIKIDGSPLLFAAIEDLEADNDNKGDKLSAQVSAETESHVGDQSFTVQVTMAVTHNGVVFKVNDIKALIS